MGVNNIFNFTVVSQTYHNEKETNSFKYFKTSLLQNPGISNEKDQHQF